MPNIKKLLQVSRELRDAAERLGREGALDDLTRSRLGSLVSQYDAALKQSQKSGDHPRSRQELSPQQQPGKGNRRPTMTADLAALVPGSNSCLFFPLQPADTHETLSVRVRGIAHYHGWKLIVRSVWNDEETGTSGIRVWRKT